MIVSEILVECKGLHPSPVVSGATRTTMKRVRSDLYTEICSRATSAVRALLESDHASCAEAIFERISEETPEILTGYKEPHPSPVVSGATRTSTKGARSDFYTEVYSRAIPAVRALLSSDYASRMEAIFERISEELAERVQDNLSQYEFNLREVGDDCELELKQARDDRIVEVNDAVDKAIEILNTKSEAIEDKHNQLLCQMERATIMAERLGRSRSPDKTESEVVVRQKLKEIENDLRGRDEDLRNSEGELALKAAQVRRREAEQAKREAEQAKREADVGRREAIVGREEVEIARRKLEVTQREYELAQKEAELAQKEAKLAQRESKIAQREARPARQAFQDR